MEDNNPIHTCSCGEMCDHHASGGDCNCGADCQCAECMEKREAKAVA